MAQGKTFRFDLVDVGRQVLTDHFNATLYELSAAVGALPIDKGKVATIAASLLETGAGSGSSGMMEEDPFDFR